MLVSLITASWKNSADDEAVSAAATHFYSDADALAASRGQLNSFKYLNYAHKTQDPIQGYGASNVASLHNVSNKYDPAGVFQGLVPGGFKLWSD